MLYRMTLVVANLGWVDFDLGCSIILPSCPDDSAKFHLHRQNVADSRLTKILVNPTKVHDHLL